MKLLTADRNAIAQTILDRMSAGTAGNPTLELYTGSIPASMGQPIGDTLIATLALTASVGTIADGALTFDTITADPEAAASGDIGWARAVNRDGDEAVYFTVAADGTGDINFASVSVTAGQPVGISSFLVTIGGK